MSAHKFYGPWCSFFQFHLDRTGLSQSAFADLVEEAQQNVQQYITGKVKPPIDRLEKYAEVLRLNAQDCERFMWLAHQAYTPTIVWDRIIKLEDLLMTMEKELIDLRAKVSDFTQRPRGSHNGGVQ